MKDLFSFISENDEGYNNPFILRKLDGELKQNLDANSKVIKRITAWYIVSLILDFFALSAGIIVGAAVLIEWLRNSAADYVGMYLAISFFAFGLILLIIRKLSLFLFTKSKKVRIMNAEREKVKKQINARLHIPENSVEIDVLRSFALASRHGSPQTDYWCLGFSTFIDDDQLCFADIDVVYGVPISSFTTITKNTAKVFIAKWDRELLEKNPKYIPYANKRHKIKVNEIYSVEFTYLSEQWQFFIPVYELETIKKFIGINPIN